MDLATPEGRAQERLRRLILTAFASAGAKAIALLTTLISVPLTVNYLGTERYGLWMTLSSVITILSFADLGLGNGLLNAIAEANGKDDETAAHRYVSSTFYMLLGLAILCGVVFGICYPFISWSGLFNVSSPLAMREAGPAVVAFVVCFLLNMPLGITQRVQMGYQEGFANSIWQGVGNLLGLVGVLLAISQDSGLPVLVLLMAGGPVVAAAINSVVLFTQRRPWLRPTLGTATLDGALTTFRLGILFFVLQLAGAIAFLSDNIVAARLLSAEAVTQYSVPNRLFGIAPMIVMMVLVPLWPAYGEAIARNDTSWIRRTLVRSVVLTVVLTGIPSAALVAFGRPIIRAWVGPEVIPSLALLLGLGLWTVVSTVGNAIAIFLNGSNRIGFQVITAVLMSIAALIMKILLTRTVGLPGIVWGTLVGYSFFSLLPMALYLPRLVRRMTSVEPVTSSPLVNSSQGRSVAE